MKIKELRLMFVECCKNNGTDYLRLVKSQRVLNAKGFKTVRKMIVFNIGPLSRYDDGKPDYVERLKKSYKAGDPLIPELKPYCENERIPEIYRFALTEGSSDCIGHPRHCSQLLLEKILEELGLAALMSSYKGFTKMQYDVYGFFKLLVFGRILNPDSKWATARQNDDYYDPILRDYNPDNIYDTLDFIAENKDRIIRRVNTNLVRKAGRSPALIYYDVTNFYFEIEEPDEDVVDENGNILCSGLRKFGVCKEERKQPIVQMSMFMDNQGIPIAIESFPGNTLDHLTLRPALQKNIDNMEFSRFILVADRGICQYRNLLALKEAGNGYIVSKSLLKSSRAEQLWAYSGSDWIVPNDKFKYKSRILKRKLKDENDITHEFEEKIVVYWSKNFQDRAERENRNFLQFLEKLEKNPESFRITSLQAKSLRRFMKRDFINQKTGESINSAEIKPLIDFEKVKEFRDTLGYYQIISSELTMDPIEIIDKYHGLTQIEEQFRVMKGTLDTRPVFVRNPARVTAHLLVCFVALVVLRIIQKRLKDSGSCKKPEDQYWFSGLSAERIRNALNKWKVDRLPEDHYRFTDLQDPDLSKILNAFQLNIPAKLYRRGELKALKSNMIIFT